MIQFEQDGAVLTMRLDRPDKMNAMTNDMYLAMANRLLEVQSDETVRVILVTASGDHFCAGNDMQDFARIAAQQGNAPDPSKFAPVHLLHALVDNQRPMVAAVKGNAVGIGLTLLLHCDLVVCAADARLQTPFVDLGLVPEAGSSQIMPQRFGRAVAAELLLLGAPVSGQRAYEIGLCNRAVSAGEVDATALKLAQLLAAKPPKALSASRAMLQADSDHLHRLIDQELQIFFRHLQGSEAASAMASFFQRKH